MPGTLATTLMRFPLLTVVLASVVAAPSLRAQEVPVPDSASPTVVTYTLRAVVPTTDAPVPAVLTLLSNDENLARLDVATRPQIDHTVDAVFVFGSVTEFVAWRESPGTVAWMRNLEENSVRVAELNVRRRLPRGLQPVSD